MSTLNDPNPETITHTPGLNSVILHPSLAIENRSSSQPTIASSVLARIEKGISLGVRYVKVVFLRGKVKPPSPKSDVPNVSVTVSPKTLETEHLVFTADSVDSRKSTKSIGAGSSSFHLRNRATASSYDHFIYHASVLQYGVEIANWMAQEFGWSVETLQYDPNSHERIN